MRSKAIMRIYCFMNWEKSKHAFGAATVQNVCRFITATRSVRRRNASGNVQPCEKRIPGSFNENVLHLLCVILEQKGVTLTCRAIVVNIHLASCMIYGSVEYLVAANNLSFS